MSRRSQGHIVPTSLVEEQGVLYVGNLNLFPIDPQWAKIMTVEKGVFDSESAAGIRCGRFDWLFTLE